jgi:hypothetical protein
MLRRHRLYALQSFFLGVLLIGSSCSNTMTAPSPAFAGSWSNVNSATGDLVAITISETTMGLVVHPYGACAPTSCDWGAVAATPVRTGLSITGYVATFSFPSCCTDTVTLTINSSGNLQAVHHAHFTDNSGRSDYDVTDVFAKS